jgi:biopolymer transport protein ExbB
MLDIWKIGSDLLASDRIPPTNNSGSTILEPVKEELKLTLLDMLAKGGWVMIPLAILLIGAIYLFFERYLLIRKAAKLNTRFIDTVLHLLKQGNLRQLQEVCRNEHSLIGTVFNRGVQRLGSPIQEIETGMEGAARMVVTKLEKNLALLAAIATLAPLFGFLGTVMGMIKAFSDIAIADNLSIGVIAEGIYGKMITSASGLVVGILAYVGFIILHTMIGQTVHKIEDASNQFIDTLYQPQK